MNVDVLDKIATYLLILGAALIVFGIVGIAYDTTVYGDNARQECYDRGYLTVEERPSWLLDENKPLICGEKIDDDEAVIAGWKP